MKVGYFAGYFLVLIAWNYCQARLFDRHRLRQDIQRNPANLTVCGVLFFCENSAVFVAGDANPCRCRAIAGVLRQRFYFKNMLTQRSARLTPFQEPHRSDDVNIASSAGNAQLNATGVH
jgi:hypothetical protein